MPQPRLRRTASWKSAALGTRCVTGGRGYRRRWQSVDVRLLGRVLVWAATSPEARNEHFIVTNSEPFSWREAWPYMADELGMEVAADLPTELGTFLTATRRRGPSSSSAMGCGA